MDSPVIQAVVLGVLQGLCEFLPVSSSGHLALAQQIIPGFSQPGLLLDVMLHVGTLIAVLAYFRKDLVEIVVFILKVPKREVEADKQTARLVLGVVIASIPTAGIGLLLEERMEELFESTTGVGVALAITGMILIAGDLIGMKVAKRPGNPGWLSSFMVGVAQGLAVVPGISRSGATISMARSLGVGGKEAARFSFLASIPVMLGAALLTVLKNAEEIAGFSAAQVIAYIAGPLMAAAVGYAAIEVVMRTIKSGRFKWFAVYCLGMGMGAVALGLFKGA